MGRRMPESRTAKPGRSRPSAERRRWIIGGLCFLWFGVVVARLYYFQVIDYVDLLGRAQRQQQHTLEIAPERGAIYDRQMNPLAMSLEVDSIYAAPSELANPQMIASLLAPVLGMDTQELRARFLTTHSFCWVKRRVTPAEASRVRDLNLKGIYFQRETKRFYPNGPLAAQTVGYVGLDDRGLGGIEYSLDEVIKGKPGRVLIASDARRRDFSSSEWPGVPGKNVVLTLDEKIQYIAEKALAEQLERSQAASGVAVVQNPNTGEILALASLPTFNPNDYEAAPAAARLDRAAGWIYEPGSTFKAVTLAAALEENLTNPQEVIDCQHGGIMLAGHVIHDHQPYGDLSVTDVLANSSDVGFVKIGLRLGEDRFYRYIQNYGFGAKTNVDLPGEERGLLRPPSRWSGLSIGELSIGQEIGVTPLQMVSLYSTIANGGIRIQPRVVHDVFLGSHHDSLPPAPGRRIMSARTAELMRQMLEAVVDHGTGIPAQLGGYTSAGKTGTAQKVDAGHGYSKFVGSFIGFAPAIRPAVTILVVIDSPVGAHYGTEVAAPVFRSIAEQTLGYLNVPQDNPSRWPQIVTPKPVKPSGQKTDDFMGFLPSDRDSLGAATSPVLPASFTPRTSQDSPAHADLPAAGIDSSTVVLGDGPLVTVPNFSGWAARSVAVECGKLGLELNVRGSGLAVEQNPVAGLKVPAGTKIWVRMAR